MDYTTKNNLTQKINFVRMFVIFNLISFISFQLILAPCIYAKDISNATDTSLNSIKINPVILAINENQRMKEIEELEQEEKEFKEREIQIQEYKGMVATGKIVKWSAWGVGIIGTLIALQMDAELRDKYQRNPVPKEDEDYSSSNIMGIGSIIAAFGTWGFGKYLVGKGEKGLIDLGVSSKHNGLVNKYYVSYQLNF